MSCWERIKRFSFNDRLAWRAHNPFMVVSTNEAVIKDHNDIWNDPFADWLRELVMALESAHEKRLARLRAECEQSPARTTAKAPALQHECDRDFSKGR